MRKNQDFIDHSQTSIKISNQAFTLSAPYLIGLGLITILFFLRCHSQDSHSEKNKGDILSKTDTFVKDIPLYLKSMEVQNFFLKEQSMLGLNSIKSGYNGSQIRMWIKHGYGENPKNSSQLIVIKRNDNGFSGELHTYLLKYGENWDSIVSITKRLDILKPESGWKDLIDKMEKLDINVLPDYQKIAGYYVNADSYGVMVEISSNEKYRLYYYPDYMERKDQFKQAMNMFEIMRLMEREFNIKLIY